MKALNREIPWRLIPEAERADFIEAARKEWAEWLRWGAVRPVTRSELRVLRREQVMTIRCAYR